MPRRREVPKRKILPDPKYNEVLVAKFVNTLMFDGKKSTAESILYNALDMIEEAAVSNLYVQYDVYHMQIMEGDLVPTMRANIDSIGHIQIADTPGRHEPGTGEINYPFVLNAVDAMGYSGWVGCEYKPLTTTLEGLDWATDFLKQ